MFDLSPRSGLLSTLTQTFQLSMLVLPWSFRRAVIGCAAALLLSLPASAQKQTQDSDRAAILADIDALVVAYLRSDIEKIYSSRTKDWTGFLGRSSVPLKGVDEYMRFQGLKYPPATDAPKPDVSADLTPYRITNFDVSFVTRDVAVANLILEYGKMGSAEFVTASRIRITDVYAKRKGVWVQVASHSSADPNWRAAK